MITFACSSSIFCQYSHDHKLCLHFFTQGDEIVSQTSQTEGDSDSDDLPEEDEDSDVVCCHHNAYQLCQLSS